MKGVAGDASGIPEGDQRRFDRTGVFSREGSGWRFEQVPQRQPCGDGDRPTR